MVENVELNGGTLPAVEIKSPQLNPPKLDISMFSGTVEQATTLMVDAASTLIDTIVAPLDVVYGTIDTMFDTYETTVSTAKASLEVLKIASPELVTKTEQEIDRAETYKAKVSSIKEMLDGVMVDVQYYIDYGKEIVDNATKHSSAWIEEKINMILEKIYSLVQQALDKATAKLQALADDVQKKAKEAEEKLKKAAEEKVKETTKMLQEKAEKSAKKAAENQQALASA